MHYDQKFVQSLPRDYRWAVLAIVNEFFMHLEQLNDNMANKYSLTKETHALLSAYFQKQGPPLAHLDLGTLSESHVVLRPLTGEAAADVNTISQYLYGLRILIGKQVNLEGYETLHQQFSVMLDPTVFHYEFSEGDLTRIQTLVNELRDLIVASEELEERHKRRVLGRLEKLQSELHKKVSDLSWFWGEIIEASLAAKIIGENAKPIVDRIREIVGIVWPVEARAFDLPSDTPFKLPGQTDGRLGPTSRPSLGGRPEAGVKS